MKTKFIVLIIALFWGKFFETSSVCVAQNVMTKLSVDTIATNKRWNVLVDGSLDVAETCNVVQLNAYNGVEGHIVSADSLFSRSFFLQSMYSIPGNRAYGSYYFSMENDAAATSTTLSAYRYYNNQNEGYYPIHFKSGGIYVDGASLYVDTIRNNDRYSVFFDGSIVVKDMSTFNSTAEFRSSLSAKSVSVSDTLYGGKKLKLTSGIDLYNDLNVKLYPNIMDTTNVLESYSNAKTEFKGYKPLVFKTSGVYVDNAPLYVDTIKTKETYSSVVIDNPMAVEKTSSFREGVSMYNTLFVQKSLTCNDTISGVRKLKLVRGLNYNVDMNLSFYPNVNDTVNVVESYTSAKGSFGEYKPLVLKTYGVHVEKAPLYVDTIKSETNVPLQFESSSFNFKGGDMVVDGTITCKEQLKVVEVESDKIKTKDITVDMGHAADYVFADDYELKPLGEVKAYVKENKHLPGIPSAAEMEKNGMSLSEMTNLLLEKVEELTLHMIRLEEENQSLKAELEATKK